MRAARVQDAGSRAMTDSDARRPMAGASARYLLRHPSSPCPGVVSLYTHFAYIYILRVPPSSIFPLPSPPFAPPPPSPIRAPSRTPSSPLPSCPSYSFSLPLVLPSLSLQFSLSLSGTSTLCLRSHPGHSRCTFPSPCFRHPRSPRPTPPSSRLPLHSPPPVSVSPPLATRPLLFSLHSLLPSPLRRLIPASTDDLFVPIASFPFCTLAKSPHASFHPVSLPSPSSPAHFPLYLRCSSSSLLTLLPSFLPSPSITPFLPSPLFFFSPRSLFSSSSPGQAQIAFPTPISTTDDLMASMASLHTYNSRIDGLPLTSYIAYQSLARHVSTHQLARSFRPRRLRSRRSCRPGVGTKIAQASGWRRQR
ncbi:hypothetical protein B0H11DRAFT_319244 [Mycena galericulata]|nr:hypothetical protein B0H11DRAFT_319244 [Mycena galericulata]